MKHIFTFLLAAVFTLSFGNKALAQDSFDVKYFAGRTVATPSFIKAEANYKITKMYNTPPLTPHNTLATTTSYINAGQANSFLASPPSGANYAQIYTINNLKVTWNGSPSYTFSEAQIDAVNQGGEISFSVTGATIRLTGTLVNGNKMIYNVYLTLF